MRCSRLRVVGAMTASFVAWGLFACGTAGLGVAGRAGAQPPQPGPGAAPAERDSEFTDRVTLPVDRTANRKIEQARRWIKDEDWAQAVRLIQSILDINEDKFLKDENGRWVSVRAEANRLLGTLPKEGLQFYEQQFGAVARAALKQGQASGDPRVYADVALRYMHTEAGLDAAALLGTYHLDHGRYIVAALCFERLLQREGAAEKLSPLTLYKAALASERAGNVKGRDRAWAELQRKLDRPGEKPLPAALRRLGPEDLKARLALKENGQPARGRFDWPMFLGSPDRAAQTDGGAPFLEPRFRKDTVRAIDKPTTGEGQKQDALKTWLDKAMAAKQPLGPPLSAASPVAVGDTLVYRSYWGVHAVNIKSGQPKWQTPSEGSLFSLANQPGLFQQPGQWAGASYTYPLSVFYGNSLVGTLSTDNARVYLVEDLAIPPPVYDQRMMGMGGSIGSPELQRWTQYNRLTAYNLENGRLAWAAGTAEDNQPFSDTFFLGPPLPLADKLYVLAEVNQDIRLLCLQPHRAHTPDGKFEETVSLVWSQTLCAPDRRVIFEPMRRTQAAHLAYGDGVLVCPTNAGVVLGVDLLTHALLWAHSYQENRIEEPAQGPVFGPGGRGRPQFVRPLPVTEPTWAPSAPVIRDGKVVFTAWDAKAVHCLSLADGSLLWKQERTNDLYLGGVSHGKVLLVGRDSCRALSLADGKEVWKVETGMPSGRGVANESTYFLPLKNAEVWAIDWETGRIQGKSRATRRRGTDPRDNVEAPGNLIFHDGDVLCQTPTAILAYPQLAVKEQEINARLAQNPKDPTGLTERGELRLHQGELTGAVDDLHAALANNPPAEVKDKARLKLYEALADLLERDFAQGERHLSELEELAGSAPPSPGLSGGEEQGDERRDRRARYLRILARGREGQGRVKEALAAYLDFAGLGHDKMIAIAEEANTRVIPETWARGRIESLLRRADAAQKKVLEEAFQEQWQQTEKAGDAEALRRFVALFGPLCEQGRKAQLLQAERLIEKGEVNQAQIELWQLLEQSDPTIAARALETLARLHTRLGNLDNAAHFYEQLATRFPKVIVRDGKTGEELYQELATDKRFLPYLSRQRFSLVSGQALRALPGETVSATSVLATGPRFWLEADREPLPLLRRYRLGIDPDQAKLVVIDRLTNEERGGFSLAKKRLVLTSVGVDASQFRPTYHQIGPVIVFSWLNNVYAYDLLKRGPRPLWTRDLDPTDDDQTGSDTPQLLRENGVWKIFYSNGTKELLGTLGPVEPGCVCFLVKDKGLIAVDPLSGKDRWVKSDVPLGTQLFGDGETIFLVPASRGTPVRGQALRATDGATVAVPEFAPLFEKRLRILGRRLLVKDAGPANELALRLYDVLTGQDVWRSAFAPGSLLLASHSPQWVGVIEPTGRLTVLDAESGKPLLSAAVEPELARQPEIHLLVDSDRVYLFTNLEAGQARGQRQTTASGTNVRLRHVRVEGPALALDKAGGAKAWQRNLPPQLLVAEQFDDLPLLLFACERIEHTPAGQRNTQAVLALDKRDGSVVADKTQDGQLVFEAVRVDWRLGTVDLLASQRRMNQALRFRFEVQDDRAAGGTTPPPGAKAVGAAETKAAPMPKEQVDQIQRFADQLERQAVEEAVRRARERKAKPGGDGPGRPGE